jgi:hypothetical protein
MSENTTDNVIDMVNEAQKRGKFNLADAIKGRAFPEKSVDVYLDANSAMELEAVNQELQYLSGLDDPTEYNKLDEVAQELAERIKKSKLTFHMRGVGQAEVEAAVKAADELHPDANEEQDNPEWVKYYLSRLIAANIVKVTDADGNEDDSKFTVEEMMELRGVIPIDSWAVLVETMQKLTLATSYFSAVTDAGFLPKS